MVDKEQRPPYTAADRERAVARARETSYAAAAKELDIPVGTIAYWVHRARHAGPAASPPSPPSQPVPPPSRPVPSLATAKPAPAPSADGAPEPPPRRTQHVARQWTPSQKAEILEDAGKLGVTEAAKKHNCSRFSIYDWRRKVERAVNGEGEAPTSGPAPTDVEAQRDGEVLGEWRKHPGLGPSQIKNQLRRVEVWLMGRKILEWRD